MSVLVLTALIGQIFSGVRVYAAGEEQQEEVAPSSYTADDYIDYYSNGNDLWKLYYMDSWLNSDNKCFTASQMKNINITYGFGYTSNAFMVDTSKWVVPADSSNSTPAYISKTQATTGYWNNQYTMTKGFTVPEAGRVKLYNPEPIRGIDNKVGDVYCGASIRITKNNRSTVIKDYVEIVREKNGCTVDGDYAVYEMEPIELDVEAGDVLYFEVRDVDCKTSQWAGIISWNPCVEYCAEEEEPSEEPSDDYVAPPEDATSYTADTYIDYNENSNSIWKLYYMDYWMNNEHKAFTAEQVMNIDEKYCFGKVSNAFMDDTSTWVSPFTATDSNKTPPYISKTQITTGYWNNQYTMTKGFTAPKTGKIRIFNPKPIRGFDHVYGDEHYGASVRITRNSKDNAVMDYFEVVKGADNCTTVDNVTTYSMKPIELEIKKGETLFFDVCDVAGKTSQWAGIIEWNPCVYYLEEYEVPSEKYQASEYYDTSKVENGPWACQYYDAATRTYKNMAQNIGWTSGFGEDGGQGDAWLSADKNPLADQEKLTANWSGLMTLTPAVGKYKLRPEVNEDSKGYVARMMPRAVRTFTAPNTGRIKITADDGNGNSRILGTKNDDIGGAFVRIMYNGRMIWPNSSSLDGVQIPGVTKNSDGVYESADGCMAADDGASAYGYVSQEELTLDVKKGDKIYFEVHNGTLKYNFWNKFVYWDPIVEYEQTSSYAENIIVKDNDGNELTDFEAVVEEGSCTVSADISSVYHDLGKVALAAAIYDADGTLLSVGYDTNTLAMNDTAHYAISIDDVGDAEGGYMKLFAFDSMDDMKPVRIKGIGGTDGTDSVLMKTDDSWMPTYENVSGDFYAPYSGNIKVGNAEPVRVSAGDAIDTGSGTTIHYTNLREETVTVTPKSKEGASGKLMFEANDFLNKIGVMPEKTSAAYTGEFNGAEIKIPLSGDVAYYDSVNIELDDEIESADGDLYVSAEYFDCFYGVSVDGGTAAVTVYRPGKTVNYEDRMEALTGGVEIMDGSRIYDISASGTGYSIKSVTPDDGSFEKVLRMETTTQPATDYSYRNGITKCNTEAYSCNDVLVMSFWARATYIMDDMGAAYVGVALEAPNWDKDFGEKIQVDSEWKKYYIPVTARADRAANSMWLFFYYGFKPQTVEVADLKIVNYGKSVDISDLQNTEKEETYKGREADALWREQALKRIEKYRTDEVTVRVLKENGTPFKNINVSAKMTKSAFIFGTEQAGYNHSVIGEYIKKYFNGITASYAKLGMYEPDNVASVLQFAKDNDMYSRGHALVYDHSIFMYGDSEECQKWDMYTASGINPKYKSYNVAVAKFDDYIKDRMETFPGFTQWDVLNEPDSVYTYRGTFGNKIAAEWFKSFKNYAVNGEKAYINSCLISGKKSQDSAAQNFADLIKGINEAGGSRLIDGGGIQCHLGGVIYPQDLYNQIDTVAKEVDEVMLTEFDIKTMTVDNLVKQEDEAQLESDLVRDILIALYSNPKAAGFITWGTSAYNQNQGLFLDKDFNEKPTLDMWKELVMDEWMTKVSGKTDENGEFTFRGHFGDYDISLVKGGSITGSGSKAYTVAKDKENVIEVTAVKEGSGYVFKFN